jgi:hypothetical protein
MVEREEGGGEAQREKEKLTHHVIHAYTSSCPCRPFGTVLGTGGWSPSASSSNDGAKNNGGLLDLLTETPLDAPTHRGRC